VKPADEVAPEPTGRPTLRVVSGDASAEELAALLAVIGSRSGPAARKPERSQSGWQQRSRGLRGTLQHGPGAWTESGRPR
jgi:hypothetical protein